MKIELTKMELEGMKNGAFPMEKEAGIEACRAYRAALEAQGIKTELQHLAGSIFCVVVSGSAGDIPVRVHA